MSVEKRDLLRTQLVQQSQMIATEKNDVKLIQSMLVTCMALLCVAEKSIPSFFAQEEFDEIYAGYLGIASKVYHFHEVNQKYLNDRQSVTLNDVLESLHLLEEKRRALDSQLSVIRKKAEEEKGKIDLENDRLLEEQEKYNAVKVQHDMLQERLSEIQNSIASSGEENESIRSQIANHELDLERLINEVEDAKNTYADLMSYYEELKRIEVGMKDEGYVDIRSFTDSIQDMNVQAKNLMASYDKVLKEIATDVEALQSKIKEKRELGVTE